MLLIVGLGNPGGKYSSTRHNIGFMVVDQVVKDLVKAPSRWEFQKDINADTFKSGDLVFAKPQTFMNASGFAVVKLIRYYKIDTTHVWVVHDDIDLPLGKIRIRVGGGSAGHHGVDSILRSFGGKDEFVRFRLGVGRGKLAQKKHADQNLGRHAVEKYVVSRFTTHEEGEVRKLIKHAAKAVEVALHKGLDQAMNHFN